MIRAEVYAPDAAETVLAVATWSAGTSRLEVTADPPPDGLQTLLRAVPVVVDDASLRSLGAHGESVLEPGSLDWFRAALTARVSSLGLAVRFVAEEIRGGWDPASNYRTFAQQIDRLVSS